MAENSVSLSEAAAILGISYKTAWRAVQRGDIPALKPWNSTWRVNSEWVMKAARSAEDSNQKNG